MLELSKEQVLDKIVAWCKQHPDIEVTGLVARGPAGDRVVPMRNVARQPERYYEWAPADMVEQWAIMDELEEHPVAFYHSHPNGRTSPSERDMEGALFVGVHHLIMAWHEHSRTWAPHLYECPEYGVLVGDQLEVTT